jgi:predicted MFS family arabinose efflux permease
MRNPDSPVPVGVVVMVGLSSLAAAMGLGRFALTPLLPLMQEAFGTTLSQGAWLASANYLGYFVGACCAFLVNPRAGRSARAGLLAVAASTVLMGPSTSFGAWLALRFASGIGSAFVLVGASTWALSQLASHRRPDASGWVFAGVGVGVTLAGLVALAFGVSRQGPQTAWVLLGTLCALVAAATWRPLATSVADLHDRTAPSTPLARSEWTLVACYGVFGYGYIIPATFIPAAARMLVNDPAVFGWTWPVFGLAAAASTIAVSTIFRTAPPLRVAAWSLAVMSVGVAAPLFQMSVFALVVSSLCVGGTFMVMTMASAQEARRIAVDSPTRLMAALTSAFALGQMAGPLVIGIGKARNAVVLASGSAVALLLLSALVLLNTSARAGTATAP